MPKKTNLGLNFMREIKRDVQNIHLNRVNTKIGAVITKEHLGRKDIKPQYVFYSYVSAYYQADFAADRTFKGLDIKYGINDAFLDAI
jgi:hypothetical protein